MSRYQQSSRFKKSILFWCAVAALSAVSIGFAQSRIIRPQSSSNSNKAKKARIATLRASDSPQGSRVSLSADQSLGDYEAYRRGDRFYVKIPPADVPRAEIVRGRAFADVKVQRSLDSTVVSFRLQPGATAHVEQRGNKLDVVFTMPGASSSSTGREVARNDAGPAPPPDSKRPAARNSNFSRPTNSTTTGNKNANASSRQTLSTAKPSPTPKTGASPASSPASATLKASPSPQLTKSLSAAQVRNSPTPSPAAANTAPTQGDFWNRFKERARYWILVAQLNPVPVAIGVAVLLLLIGMLILQRRRAKATRRARVRKSLSKAASVAEASKSKAPEPESAELSQASAQLAAAALGSAAMAPPSTERASSENGRGERVSRVSEEVKRLMTGGEYDEGIIGSNDRDTRQLVGAELLSALVGRDPGRRARARNAFMKHGYFDDATRDLRVAESDNERAAAARRLSFVRDSEATPHLIAALDDPSSDVRRAAVEALMDLRDPSAIAPLNSLMQTETDRKVPRSLIKHAIDACATAPHEVSAPAATSLPSVASLSPTAGIEREVIEI